MPDYKTLLEGLGFTRVQPRGEEFVAVCVFCGLKKFYLNTRKKSAICFRGCFAGSAASLIARIEGCDFEEAKARVEEGANWYTKMNLALQKPERTNPRRIPFIMPKTRDLNAEELAYLTERNVNPRIAVLFGAMGTDDHVGMIAAFRDCDREEAEDLYNSFPDKFDYLKDRILWPVTLGGEIIGAEARSYKGHELKVCYPTGVNLKRTLFSCPAPEKIGQGPKWAIIVEGILDALTVRGWGFPVDSTFSSGISREQAQLLLENERLYSGYDPDHGGEIGLESVVKRLHDGMLIYEMKLPKGKDPNECSRREFSKAFIEAKLISSSHPVMERIRKQKEAKGSRRP